MAWKFPPDRKEVLLSPSRMENLDPYHIVSLLPIRPYHVVVDVGCGPGYFAIPLGKSVFEGKVYAIDVEQEMLDTLRQRMAEVHLGNIEPRLNKGEKLSLDPDSLDGALIAFVIHEFDDKEGLLTQVREGLHAGGWAAVLDWQKKETEYGPPLEVRVTMETVEELAAKAGLHLVSRKNLNSDQFMVLLRK